MSLIATLVLLVFHLLLFSRNAQLQPSFTSQPSSQRFVLEGNNLVLQWSYDLAGRSIQIARFANVTASLLEVNIVIRNQNTNVNGTVQPGFEQQFSAAILDTQATVTAFGVPRSYNGDRYQFSILDSNSLPVPNPVTVEISVLYAPDIIHISGNQTVKQNNSVSLNCKADGNPPPNITWTRLSDNTVVYMPLTITGKQDEGYYRCTANNTIGSPSSADVYITVLYQPNITDISSNQAVNESDVLLLSCTADGNPQPNITWTTLSNNRVVTFPLTIAGKQDEGDYRCTADNGIGNPASSDVFITVLNYRAINTSVDTPDLTNNTVVLNASFNLTCNAQANPPAKYQFYRGQESLFNTTVGSNLAVYTTSVNERNKSVIYRCIPFNDYGDGPTQTITVTVHYPPERTNYNQTVKVTVNTTATLYCPVDGNPEPDITWYEGNDTSGTLVQSGKVLNFPEATSSDSGWYTCFANNSLNRPVLVRLRLLVELIKPSTTPQTTPNEPHCQETFIKDKNCSIIAWKIVVLALAGVVLIAFVVGIVAWWVHKRRKCRKDPRIHHSEERLHGNAENNAYSQVNHEYAGTGPRPNGTEAVALQQRAATDGRDATSHRQEVAAIPTYAEVDKSKKSKKKPKHGEMIYADLEDTNVPRPMPTVSTSPQPLVPIKRPEPYENTQYADITQFLKGDATLPQSDSNQGTELQPQDVSKDEGGAGGEDRNTPM